MIRSQAQEWGRRGAVGFMCRTLTKVFDKNINYSNKAVV
jgi:hypothetical protein